VKEARGCPVPDNDCSSQLQWTHPRAFFPCSKNGSALSKLYLRKDKTLHNREELRKNSVTNSPVNAKAREEGGEVLKQRFP